MQRFGSILCSAFLLCNAAFLKAQPTAALVEIGLATGKVIRGELVRRDRQKMVYRASESPEERELPLSEVIFVRDSTGRYEFIFPPEETAPTEQKPQEKKAANLAVESESTLFVGLGLTTADNSPLTDFTRDVADVLANDYNARLSPAGFVAQPGLDAASITTLVSAEYRRTRSDYLLGLMAAFALLPKSSAVVSSANYVGQETINADGYAVPVALLFYYQLWGDRDFGLKMGFGGGALFTSVLVTRNFGNKSDYEEFWGLAPLLVLRPELAMRWGSLSLLMAAPVFWAEGRPVRYEIAGESRSAAASLTGGGITLAVGINL